MDRIDTRRRFSFIETHKQLKEVKPDNSAICGDANN